MIWERFCLWQAGTSRAHPKGNRPAHRCTVGQFDINNLRDLKFEKIGDAFPAVFDLVIVPIRLLDFGSLGREKLKKLCAFFDPKR